MNQTAFEQELDAALNGIGCSLGSPMYRQDILLARQVSEAGNPLLRLFKERAAEGNAAARFLFTEEFTPVRRRTGKVGSVVLEYDLLLLAENAEEINSASEAKLEEMIKNAIGKGPLNEKFRAYVPPTLKSQEGMTRRQKIIAKFLAQRRDEIVSISNYAGSEGWLADVKSKYFKAMNLPYNPKELAELVVRNLSAYKPQ